MTLIIILIAFIKMCYFHNLKVVFVTSGYLCKVLSGSEVVMFHQLNPRHLHFYNYVLILLHVYTKSNIYYFWCPSLILRLVDE